MKRATLAAGLSAAACTVLFFALTSQPGFTQSSVKKAEALETRLPLLFEKNEGQVDAKVQYLVRSGKYQVYLVHDAAILRIAGKDQDAVLRISPYNSNQDAKAVGFGRQTAQTNYLVGPSGAWKTGITNFAAVKYEAVYPGVDLKYYGQGRQLEYDFDVAPHADPSNISLNVEGADKVSTDEDGSLLLKTKAGEVRWLRPVAYQDSASGRTLVSAAYHLDGNRISFRLGSYDGTKPLVIDPVMAYGTFLDGSDFDSYHSFLVDSAGFAYIVGTTTSPDFPITPGAYQNYHTTNNEGFVSKLSQDGSHLIWSTMIAGTGPHTATSINGFALDSVGSVYLIGQTGDFTLDSNGNMVPITSTFPTSAGAYNSTELAGWRYYLAKLNSTGTALDFSTFLSTQPNIYPYGVAVDAASNVYVTGFYNHAAGLTAAFPATSGAYQTKWAGGNDAFAMKFNSNATALDYATLLGGGKDDAGAQIVVNSNGDATVAGQTYSMSYPITPNGKRQTADFGSFITTLNSTGSALLYSTVLNNVETINLKRDAAGYYYAGGSAGPGLPTTKNAFQKAFPTTAAQTHLGFFTEIDPSGNLVYSSYIAGNVYYPAEEDSQVLLVSPDSVTLGGNRFNDATFPVTDRNYEQDNCSYLAKFDTTASGAASLMYSGCTPVNETNNTTVNLFEGIGSFDPSQLFIDSNDNLYAINTDGPTSSNAFQKAPPNPGAGNGSFIWFGKYNLAKPGPGGVNLSSPPIPVNIPIANPVPFRATGRSPQCSAGVAAMRVYTSPGVIAYTTQSATLDANIWFPVSGSQIKNFQPVIVVYDNCGSAFSLTVPVVVQASSTAPSNPLVISPTDGTSTNGGPQAAVTSPVHFVASASSPQCSNGISAMRIYTAPGVTGYTVNKASIDTYLKMANGTHNVVVQAWDNCGNVYKTPLQVTVE